MLLRVYTLSHFVGVVLRSLHGARLVSTNYFCIFRHVDAEGYAPVLTVISLALKNNLKVKKYL